MKLYNPKTMVEVDYSGRDFDEEEFNNWAKTLNAGEIARHIAECVRPPVAEEDDFLWTTHKGDFIYVSAMQTDHLFNALKMLWNHGVPPAFRIGSFTKRPEIYKWDNDYKYAAYLAMLNELDKREDKLNEDQKDQLEDIGQNSRAFQILLNREDPKSPMVGQPYNVD